MFCVRVPHELSGLSFSTTESTEAFAPRLTARVLGYEPPAPSQ